MSVLVKGMEMPKNCYDCEVIDIVKDCPHYYSPTDAYCQIPWLRKRRHENCPLVPVPPHGRLIDADALYEEIDNLWDGRALSPVGATVLSQIGNADTIIPAEEGNDNGQTDS